MLESKSARWTGYALSFVLGAAIGAVAGYAFCAATDGCTYTWLDEDCPHEAAPPETVRMHLASIQARVATYQEQPPHLWKTWIEREIQQIQRLPDADRVEIDQRKLHVHNAWSKAQTATTETDWIYVFAELNQVN